MRYEEEMRRRDERGRYMEDDPPRIKYNGEDTGYPEYRHYQPGERGFKREGDYGNIPRENRNYRPSSGEYDGSSIGYARYDEPRGHEPMQRGRASWYEGLDRMTAERWVRSMGGRWQMEETSMWAKKMGMEDREAEFYAVMNAIWSDYGKTLSKYGVNTPEAYACLAKDWLEDEDAVPNKAEMYYQYIVAK